TSGGQVAGVFIRWAAPAAWAGRATPPNAVASTVTASRAGISARSTVILPFSSHCWGQVLYPLSARQHDGSIARGSHRSRQGPRARLADHRSGRGHLPGHTPVPSSTARL